jgi:hypothetical protein
MNNIAIPLVIGVLRGMVRINDGDGEARFDQDVGVGRRHVVIAGYEDCFGIARGDRSQQRRVFEAAIASA